MIIHQIWLQGWKYAPISLKERVDKNKSLWNGGQVWLWDEQRVLALLESDYPSYISWFLALQQVISKCDAARAFILHKYGGVYADCDFDPNPTTIKFFYEEAKEKVTFIGSPWYGCNNFLIASPPQHTFWLNIYIPYMQNALRHPSIKDFLISMFYSYNWKILSSSGPVAIKRLIKSYPHFAQATSAENEYAYGFHGDTNGSFWYEFKLHRKQQLVMFILVLFALYGFIHMIKTNACINME